MPGKWLKIALLNFLVAAILGLLLRYAFVDELNVVKFRNVIYAHYHTAMFGWVYLALNSLLIAFFTTGHHNPARYNKLFIVSEFAVVGMFLSYLFQGYSMLSIGLSVLFIASSYVFTFRFINELKGSRVPAGFKLFVTTALFFQILSTLALLLIYYLVLSDSNLSALYYAAVQFFLHFQFNGWFAFALLGLFFHFIELKGQKVPAKQLKIFYFLLTISCIATYALAVTWSNPIPILFWINSLGVAVQMLALLFLLFILKQVLIPLRDQVDRWTKFLVAIAIGAFCIKIFIQTAVVVPYLATIAYTIRNFVIGFIHLITLAAVSLFIFALASDLKWISLRNPYTKIGMIILLAGIILSELYLFLQGTMFWISIGFIPAYYMTIFLLSGLIPIGICFLGVGMLRKEN